MLTSRTFGRVAVFPIQNVRFNNFYTIVVSHWFQIIILYYVLNHEIMFIYIIMNFSPEKNHLFKNYYCISISILFVLWPNGNKRVPIQKRTYLWNTKSSYFKSSIWFSFYEMFIFSKNYHLHEKMILLNKQKIPHKEIQRDPRLT